MKQLTHHNAINAAVVGTLALLSLGRPAEARGWLWVMSVELGKDAAAVFARLAPHAAELFGHRDRGSASHAAGMLNCREGCRGGGGREHGGGGPRVTWRGRLVAVGADLGSYGML